MMRCTAPDRRRRGTLRLAAVAVVFGILAGPAPAQPPAPFAGRPVMALAEDASIAVLLRQASGGRQASMARRVRNPGAPLADAGDGWAYGWTCEAGRCGQGEDLFIAWHDQTRRVAFIFVDHGRPSYAIPSLNSRWPGALEQPLAAFRAALGGG